MAGIVFGLYGLAAYVFFFLTFLYAIAFVGDLPVPKTIDSGAAGALVPSLVVDTLLLGLFAFQHSVMARPAFKRWWTKIVPPPIERSTYVVLASGALVILYVYWRPLTQPIWSVSSEPIALVLRALFWAGWLIVLTSTFLLNHFELFGLRQVYDRMRDRKATDPEFRTPLFYRLIRHPIYFGFILAFWAAPAMSLGHLVFALATTAYIVVAIQFEEHDLISVFGEQYRAYRRRVGMLLPKFGGGGSA